MQSGLSILLVVEGYDLAAEGGVKAVLDEFDQVVGLHYLKAIHLNDSKGAGRIITREANIKCLCK